MMTSGSHSPRTITPPISVPSTTTPASTTETSPNHWHTTTPPFLFHHPAKHHHAATAAPPESYTPPQCIELPRPPLCRAPAHTHTHPHLAHHPVPLHPAPPTASCRRSSIIQRAAVAGVSTWPCPQPAVQLSSFTGWATCTHIPPLSLCDLSFARCPVWHQVSVHVAVAFVDITFSFFSCTHHARKRNFSCCYLLAVLPVGSRSVCHVHKNTCTRLHFQQQHSVHQIINIYVGNPQWCSTATPPALPEVCGFTPVAERLGSAGPLTHLAMFIVNTFSLMWSTCPDPSSTSSMLIRFTLPPSIHFIVWNAQLLSPVALSD